MQMLDVFNSRIERPNYLTRRCVLAIKFKYHVGTRITIKYSFFNSCLILEFRYTNEIHFSLNFRTTS